MIGQHNLQAYSLTVKFSFSFSVYCVDMLIRFTRSLHTSVTCLDRAIKTSRDRRLHFQSVNSRAANEISDDLATLNTEEPRLPKKKVALMIGFNGSEYQGMQA